MQPWAKRKIADVVDETLSAMLLADRDWIDPATNVREGHEHKRAALANLWGADFHLLAPDLPDIDIEHPGFLEPKTGSEAAEITWPLDIAVVNCGAEQRTAVGDTVPATRFMRMATISPVDVRGLVKLVPPKMVLFSNAGITEDGKPHADTHIFGLLADRWRELPSVERAHVRGNHEYVVAASGSYNRDEVVGLVHLFAGMALTERYHWHIAIGFVEGGPRLLLPTGPTGAARFLKDRDLEPGRDRRAAVKHWVSQHWRDDSRDEGSLIFVRQHLRGHTEFIWNGLFAEVLVSQYDLERNEMFRQEAALWRAQRRHNSVKVKLKRWKAA